MTYTCPVCGFDDLAEPADNFSICPSCGTEFGYDDDRVSHDELRREWIANGAKWWSVDESPPSFWSPVEQLLNVHYSVTDADRSAIASHADNYVATSFKFVSKPAMELLDKERFIVTLSSKVSATVKSGEGTKTYPHQSPSVAESREAAWQPV